jgi:hypothetical protein
LFSPAPSTFFEGSLLLANSFSTHAMHGKQVRARLAAHELPLGDLRHPPASGVSYYTLARMLTSHSATHPDPVRLGNGCAAGDAVHPRSQLHAA